MNSKLSLLIIKCSLNSSLDQFGNYLTKNVYYLFHLGFPLAVFSVFSEALPLVLLDREMRQLHRSDNLWVKLKTDISTL